MYVLFVAGAGLKFFFHLQGIFSALNNSRKLTVQFDGFYYPAANKRRALMKIHLGVYSHKSL
jgi:hypothetical protein